MGLWDGLGSSIIGAGISGGLSFVGGSSANAANSKEAARNRMFQLYMSNTAYQRGTKDLIKAGLNPMLAYGNSGASTAQGSTAQHQNALGQGVSSALEARRNYAEVKNLEVQNENLKEQTKLIPEQALQAAAQAQQLRAQSATEVTRNLRELQNIQLDRDRFGLEQALNQSLLALQGAQKRNYDANSANVANTTYQSKLDNPRREIDQRFHSTKGGEFLRSLGTGLRSILGIRSRR